ncbi:MAG: phage holin family protein [Chthoniobacteraceae bacterium]
MALPSTPGDEGLIDHLRALVASLVGYFSARFQLVGLESKEACGHYLKIVAWLIAAFFGVAFGYVFICIAAVFLISSGLKISWMWVLLAFGILHFVVAGVAVAVARAGFTKSMFSATIEEFKKDQTWLNTPGPAKKQS